MAPRVVAAWLAGLLLSGVGGEVVHLEERDLPPPFTLDAVQLIYAFSSQEILSNKVDVSFDLRVEAKPGHMTPFWNRSISVSLIPWDSFANVSNGDVVCRESSFRSTKGDKVSLELPAGNVNGKAAVTPGIYALSFSNCGPAEHLMVSGTVSVKNAHGYLGGNDSGKVAVYGFLTLVLFIATTAWACAVGAGYGSMSSVPMGVSLLSLVALASSISWLATFSIENSSGRAEIVRSLAETLLGLKAVFFVSVVLDIANGAGVISEVGTRTHWSIMIVSALCGIAYMRLSSMLEMKYSLHVEDQLLYAVLPTVVLGAVVVCWTFRSLAGTMRRCKVTDQADALLVFHRSTLLAIVGLLLFIAVLAAQIHEQPGKVLPTHLFWQDIAGNLVFCGSLFCLMFLWNPGKTNFNLAGFNRVVEHDKGKAHDEEEATLGNSDDGNEPGHSTIGATEGPLE